MHRNGKGCENLAGKTLCTGAFAFQLLGKKLS